MNVYTHSPYTLLLLWEASWARCTVLQVCFPSGSPSLPCFKATKLHAQLNLISCWCRRSNAWCKMRIPETWWWCQSFTPCLASWVLPDPSEMSMHLQDLWLLTTISRTLHLVVTRTTSQQTPGTVMVITHLPSTTLCTGVVSPVVQGKERIINLTASLRWAAHKGIGMTTRQPKKLWAPPWDVDQILLQDEAPLNLGNPPFSIWVTDMFPDALIGMNSKSINRVLHLGMKSTIMSWIPLTSWTWSCCKANQRLLQLSSTTGPSIHFP